MKFFRLPKLVPDDTPEETRLELMRSIGRKANDNFLVRFPKLSEWFTRYDAVYLLSYCAFYFASAPEGIDPELEPGETFFHHYLEIMQAFALQQKRTMSPQPLLEKAIELRNELVEVGELMSLRVLDVPSDITKERDLNAFRVRSQMMVQTTAVRNWAYIHQIRRVVLDVANGIRAAFSKEYGIDPVDLFEALFAMTDERSNLLNEHRDRVRGALNHQDHRKIFAEYALAFPDTKPIEGADAEKMWQMAGMSRQVLRTMLITHADLQLEKIYSFSIDHAMSLLKSRVSEPTLKALLDRLSMKFGDLEDFNRDHIALGNPVWTKPFIRLDERNYFSAVWGVMPHIALEMLESLVWASAELREKYTDAKAEYLENDIERQFRAAFPSAQICRGSLWSDPASGRVYENDLLVILESFALVIEAKSGTISDPARRGAPKRLFDTLRTLVEEPSEQAHRFIAYLKGSQGEHCFQTRHGNTNTVDSGRIKYYIPLGVTFSNLGTIGSNLKRLIEGGVVKNKLEELAPSISFTDVECIFELLLSEIEKLHYFVRRRELEAHLEYDGDEMDLLAFYLDTGFNIGAEEYKRDSAFILVNKSKELDPFFIGLGEQKKVQRPTLAMTQWWRDILHAISVRKTEGWTETGFVLLNTTKEDQTKFERKFKELMTRIAKGRTEKAHNWVLFSSGPARRRYVIAGYPYVTRDKEIRNGVIAEILEGQSEDARGAVVIGVQMESMEYPYTVLARRASTDLFDALTLD